MGITSTYLSIDLSDLRGRLTVQASCLEQDRYATQTNDGIDLPPIERDNILAGVTLDVCTGHKWNSLAESLPGPVQDVLLFRIAQVIYIARVHVDSIHQPSPMCESQVLGKRVDGDPAICFVRQQGGRNAMHLAARLLACDQLINRHL